MRFRTALQHQKPGDFFARSDEDEHLSDICEVQNHDLVEGHLMVRFWIQFVSMETWDAVWVTEERFAKFGDGEIDGKKKMALLFHKSEAHCGIKETNKN